MGPAGPLGVDVQGVLGVGGAALGDVQLVLCHTAALTAVLRRCPRGRPRRRPPDTAANGRPPGRARWGVGGRRATSRTRRPDRLRPRRRAVRRGAGGAPWTPPRRR